ncbi:MAG: 2-amino-4-hydroxy-6-hydroxymethyldihydropteridine diphosphokinase [Gammaproteobacteria bacterium]|nr:2-amino-4-hydroxy-6-hydroxymethyldihydropteridine diphosphokinase [Gammaproteobacteria bacterium]MBU1557331.1 2-amino-4-hydroxy-6-hydroxymethyldihydropteridine diphosphokinase [Gammaproteobacteria bacterium]MBU2072067.1 2-amino-4-hydroxy-6-hydroxymethyldihydropteridine diphosphokinase [Gammaproteobacteria bacterium]MBU2183488.1 2-amino-4-hydroxy-6-hydroxymethyldihydropteridine diphosphokinase [Gammaproteobacteria bacterium]MBU2203398.1 2-amino-4-hydroxy-6-hydroxymethyldihydropteridine diphos
MAPQRCYIGLGANLEQPVAQLQSAVQALSQLARCELVAVSDFYGSKPMGPQDQPDYVNAVAAIDTTLAAEQLLDALQQIEQQQGRQRKAERWGPRTLDLDILLYGKQIINTERLTIPHYGLRVREFVLYPLHDIAPQLSLPDGTVLSSLLAQVPLNGLQKLHSSCS